MGMQRYNYKGQSYNLSDSLSPEEALAKIKQHLGEQTDSVAPEQGKTSFMEDVKTGLAGAAKTLDVVGNLAVRAPIQAAIQGDQVLPGILDEVNERAKSLDQWANPENKPQGIGGKIVSAIPQLATGMMSPAETAKRFKESGESTGKSMAAGAIDAGAQALGLVIPGIGGPLARRVVGGAASNIAQDFASKKALQTLASKEELKKAYEPTLEGAAVAGITGAAIGAIAGKGNQKENNLPTNDKLAKAKELQAARNPEANVVSGEAAGEVAAPIDRAYMEQRRLEDLQNSTQESLRQQAELEKNQILADYHKQEMDTKRVETQKLMDDLASQQTEATRIGDIEKAAEIENHQRLLAEEQQRQQLDLGYNSEGGRNITRTPVTDSGLMGLKAPEIPEEPARTTDTALALGQYTKGSGKGPERPASGPSGIMGLPPAAQEAIKQLDPSLSLGQYTKGSGLGKQRATQGPSGVEGLPAKPAPDPFGSIGNQQRFVPKGQRGGVDFDGILKSLGSAKEKAKEIWNKIPGHEDTGTSMLAQYPDDASVLNNLKASESSLDDNVVRGQAFKSGSSMTAIFSRNPVVKATADYMQTAYKRADKAIMDFVKPAEHTFQRMAWSNKNELIELSKLFKEEMFSRTPFDISDLEGAGYTPKQIKAYTQLREMYNKAWEVQNQMLKAKDMPELSKHEYYTASRWDGDWASHVYDKDGRLVWVIKDRSKAGVNRALDYLEKNGIEIDRDKSQVSYTRNSHDIPSNMPAAYSAMLQYVTEGNPLAQKAREVMDAKMMAEAHRTLGQSKHFESKANIRGFVGDRPWMNPFEDAKDMFNQQFQYAKNAFQWSEYNQAADKVKNILDDEDIARQAPNSVAASRRIVDHYLGSSDRNLMSKVENAVAKGVGGSVQSARDVVGIAKTGWILQKMGTNTGALVQNLFQPLNSIPFHTMLSEEGYKHNPVKTMLATTMDTAAGMAEHYGKKLGSTGTKFATPIGRQAIKYAEDNGILNLSQFDEHTNINSTQAQVAVQKTLGRMIIEADKVSKFSAFMSYVHHLEQSGKYADKMELFRDAEHYMNASMVDPRMQERPFIIQDTGLLGNAASTLQGYTANYFNQFASFAHRAFVERKPAALIEFLGISGALAGLAGTTGVNGIIAAHDAYRQWLAENKPEDYDKTSDWRKWFVDLDDGSFIGKAAKYGVPSALTGADLSQKFEAQLSVPGYGPAADIAKQAGSFAGALASGDTGQLQSAIYQSAPAGLAQGNLDVSSGWFQDEKSGKYAPPSSRDYSRGYYRDEGDKLLRKLGVVSTKESKEKEMIYLQKRDEQNNSIVNKNLLNKSVDAWMKGQEDNPFFNILVKRNPEISQTTIGSAIEQYCVDHNLNAQQRAWLKAKAWNSIQRNMEYKR